MGFVDDDTRDWLYANAVAFVFPSRYEGFGLPVLEAMNYGCPVISYKNQSVVEVAGNVPYYASDSVELIGVIKEVLSLDDASSESLRKKGLSQAKKFNWSTTASLILSAITKVS